MLLKRRSVGREVAEGSGDENGEGREVREAEDWLEVADEVEYVGSEARRGENAGWRNSGS